MAEPTKAMTLRLRLPMAMAEQLTLVAQVDGVGQAEVVRRALFDYIHTRTSDPLFRANASTHITDVSLLIGDTDA